MNVSRNTMAHDSRLKRRAVAPACRASPPRSDACNTWVEDARARSRSLLEFVAQRLSPIGVEIDRIAKQDLERVHNTVVEKLDFARDAVVEKRDDRPGGRWTE